MALQVVGAGFGRTGTLSLKAALERLDGGRCYHMLEVMAQPGHAALWSRAAAGEAIDWEALLDGYSAVVDWPACHFWRELAARYPDAKVLLSVRDPDRWYESVMGTIYEAMTLPLPEDAPEILEQQMQMARRLVMEQVFEGRLADRGFAIDVYRRHNRQVQQEIPRERLLVYEVAQGWEPLCAFLGRPVPDEEFPRVNDSASFRARLGLEPL